MRTEEKIIENYTDIPALLKNCGAQRPFLCCGKSFEKTDAFAYLQAHCRLTVWDTVRPNPRYEDMVAAAELYRKEGCDFIIGAGGGSPLDSAKMIKLLITNPGVVGYDTELRDNDIPFLAIPTTSGTGSEATRYSIFYVNEDEKHSVSHPGFLPGYVLLDPCFLQTVPDYQRKCTCLDALCHAIESYWSVRSTPESRTYAQKAIRLYFEHLDGYLANTPAGNAGMLRASYNAGRAIDFTSTTAAHAMCYNITMHCHTSHGHSVAAGLAEIWDYMRTHNDRVNDPRGRDYVLDSFDRIGILMGGQNGADGAAIFRSLLERMKLQSPTATPAQCAAFAKKVDINRQGNNPTKLTVEDVEALYRKILVHK